jgi:hypothetical protein
MSRMRAMVDGREGRETAANDAAASGRLLAALSRS